MKKTIFFLTIALYLSLQSHSISAQTPTVYSWSNLPKITQPKFRLDTFNIKKFGAKPDGTTLNTQAINQAITACNKKGGGVVFVPAGIWLTGPIQLQSNVNLHLQQNATLLFTTDKTQYALVEGIYEGKAAARNQSPISGSNLENIAVTGKGIIDGNGDVWRAVHKSQLTEGEWKAKIASGGVLKDDEKPGTPVSNLKKPVLKAGACCWPLVPHWRVSAT